jgi:hypothetical protein
MVMWEVVAPMAAAIVLFLTIGGVLVLRPIAQHLGGYLEALTRRELQTGGSRDLEQMRDALETMSQRLSLIEERQDFAERLLESQDRKE